MNDYYQARINKSLDYLNENLSEDINVSKLAEASHFSLYHFQRLYKSVMSETPYDTLLRLRLEKSVFLLKHHSDYSIAEVGELCGFKSPENFSRQFKSRFDISPKAFKESPDKHNSRIYQEDHPNDFYISYETGRDADAKQFDVFVERLPEIPIAHIRGIFGEDGSALVANYLRLMEWAKERSIEIKGNLRRFGMSIDNPEVTPAGKFRYDFALNCDHIKSTGDQLIELSAIPEHDYATVQCKGSIEDVAQAWDFLYKQWLPNSNFMPVHYPALEEFIQGPEDIGWDQFNLKCRIPITPIKS